MSAQSPSKKSVTLSTKVGFDEAAALRERASQAGLTRSAFIRQAAIAGTVTPRPDIPEINKDQWSDLGRLGGNLNQIAFHLNEGGAVDANLDTLLDETRKLLSAVRAKLIGLEA